MKRTMKIFMLLALTYALPLIGAPELILHPKIVILVLACIVILLSQPDFSRADANAQKATDRNTMAWILITGFVGQIAPVMEWGYWGTSDQLIGSPILSAFGLLGIVGGLAFRVWSIRTLGRFFTPTVQIKKDHRLLTSGPYSVVRHPSYLGAYVAMIGGGLLLNAPIGTALAAIAIGFAYSKRLSVEEETLVNAFGREYRAYQKRTAKLIPLIY